MTEKSRSKLPYGLVISLIINALLIGLLVGGGLGKRGGERRSPPERMPSEMQLLSGLEARLSIPERRVLRSAIRKSLTTGPGSHRLMREARADLNRLLGQDDVSQDEIDRALDAIRDIDNARRAALHAEISKQLSQLSLDERKELAASIAKRRRSGDRWRRGDRSSPSTDDKALPDGDEPPPRQ